MLVWQWVLQGQSYVAVSVIVIFLKHIRHPLQADTALNEEVETDCSFTSFVVCSEEGIHEMGAQPVAKCDKCVCVLVKADISTLVSIKSIKEGAPRRQESPQPAEFFEADCARTVGIKHSYHHLDSIRIKGCPVAIDEGCSQLLLGQMPIAFTIC